MVQHSVQQLLAGYGSASALSQPLSEGLQAVVTSAAEILDVSSVGVLLLDEHEHLRAVAASGSAAVALESVQQEIGIGPGVDTVTMSITVTVDDLSTVPKYTELADRVVSKGACAIVSAPVWVNGSVAGNLNAIQGEAHHWSSAEVDAVETYAGLIAALLQLNASTVRDSVWSSDDDWDVER